jgi:cyanate lyase
MQQQLRLDVDEMRSLAKTLKIKLDETTRLLCKATTTMANAHILSDPELYRWHSKHILIESALKKLTKDELEALGIDPQKLK